MRKPIPKFKTDDEEAEFWDTHSTLEYVDDTTVVKLDFSHAKTKRLGRVEQVCIEVPSFAMDKARRHAHRMGIPLDRLLRRWFGQAVFAPRASRRHRRPRRLHR